MSRVWQLTLGSLRDLTPIVLVISGFQVFVLKQPIGELLMLTEGALFVVFGLTLFVYGLELALFPMGRSFLCTTWTPITGMQGPGTSAVGCSIEVVIAL